MLLISRLLNKLLDSVALTVAVAVDLVLNIICMAILAPGPLETVGFVAIAVVVVLFAVRSWIIGNKLLWALFALVCFFFDVSFSLISTDVQTESRSVVITAENDTEFKDLQRQVQESTTTLTDLRKQYREAYRRETMDELNRQIEAEEKRRSSIEVMRKDRLSRIESGELNRQIRETRSQITAEMIFGSIITAFKKGRFIPIVVFSLIFAGLQLVMITAATSVKNRPAEAEPQKKRGRRRKRAGAPEPVDRGQFLPFGNDGMESWRPIVETWVSLSWASKRNGHGDKILNPRVFRQFIANKGKTFPEERYQTILAAARRAGVIDDKNVILEVDETEAWKKILSQLLT